MLRGLLAFVVVVLTTALSSAISFVGSLLRRGSDISMRVGRPWGRLNLAAVGARVEYVDLDNATARQPCVYVANHQSNVDIWALIAVLPLHARFVAKASLFRIPVLGWALSASEFISVDRSDRAAAIRSLEQAAQKVRAGRSVVMFAEGTRSCSGKLAPFKKGPFHLALRADVPVVPVAISGSGAVLAPRALRVRPGPVRVRFFPPIDPARFQPDDTRGLMAAVRARIEAELEASEREPAIGRDAC